MFGYSPISNCWPGPGNQVVGGKEEEGQKGFWITECVSDLGLGQFHKHLALRNPSPTQRGL